MERPIIKYLDPITGNYEFSTVVDIGDLDKLNTTIKTNLVDAINSIISQGSQGSIGEEDLLRLIELEEQMQSLKDGTFEIENFDSIDNHLLQEMQSIITGIQDANQSDMEALLVEMDGFIDNAIAEYNHNVANQNALMEQSRQSIEDAEETLKAKAEELETAQIGFNEIKVEFDELDNYISTEIKTIDFDNFNAMTEDYKSVVSQTSEEVGVDLTGSTLSYLSGRVTDAHSGLSIQADEIASRMRYGEFQYMPMRDFDYNENLLFNTMDFNQDWDMFNGAHVTPEVLLFGKVIEFTSSSNRVETVTDTLEIGETYVASFYVNVQPIIKEPEEDKFAPISEAYDPNNFALQVDGQFYTPSIYEDMSGTNGWVRVYQQFVADSENPILAIRPSGINNNTSIAYMSLPKLEKGLTVSPWQPHVDDEYSTLLSTHSVIKRQADSITSFFEKVSTLDESYTQATSTFQQLAEGFATNTEKIEAYEDEVVTYRTAYENIDGMFSQKVWKEDFGGLIEDVNIDNRNRVLNSDFIRHEIDDDRKLVVGNWTLNQDWFIKEIDDENYLARERTGLSSVSNTVATTDYFKIRNGEKVLFGFELIHSGLDNDTVFSLEFFDISNTRLLKKEFKLSELNKVDNRYTGHHTLETEGVEKAKAILQLPKNGNVAFTKISVQNADIGSTDWQPAPEDSWIIQSKMQTEITQLHDEITIGALGQKMDALSGMITEDEAGFKLSPEKIATTVTTTDVFEDLGLINSTNFEQTAEGWLQEITEDGNLAGKINAMPNHYKISFDKIHLDGTTWANALGSSIIYVTEQFALIGNNGQPVLNVNSDGTVEMNVSKMNIGASQVATQKDIEDIELTPGPRGKDAVTVSLETQASAYEYTADGKLGPVKSTSIQAWHNGVLSGTVYYEFIVNGSTKQNTTNGEYMYKAPESYSDMPQTVEVKIREGSNSSNVLATDFITIVGIKPGLDGGDAYTVMLDNESHTFGGDVDNALASSLDIEVISYKGTDRIIASVGAISGLPNGMTVGVVNNNTVSPKISFTVTTSMTSPNGTITIPITVDGKVFNKIFAYSISFKGDKGKDGVNGTNGTKGQDARTVRLLNNTLAIEFNAEGYSPDVSSINFRTSVQGFSNVPYYEFLVNDTVVRSASVLSTWNYNVGSMTYSEFPKTITVNVREGSATAPIIATDMVTISGVKPGIDGKDAYTVVMANESHTFVGDVNNALASSTVANIIAYKGTSQIGVTIGSITGLPDGMTASISGNGTITSRVTFTVTTSMTSPSGSVTIPVTVDGKTFEKIFTYAISFKGKDGKEGLRGPTGTSVQSITEYYLLSTQPTGVTASTKGWDTSVPTMTSTNKYLWNYEKTTFSDGSYIDTIPVVIGVYGNKGDVGDTGRSITEVINYYLTTTASSGVTRGTSGWDTSMEPTTDSKRYLWNYETVKWSSAPLVTYVKPVIIGVHGEKGESGKDGNPGKDGVGIQKTEIHYAKSTSGTTRPSTGWNLQVPSTSPGDYIWTRTTWTYTDGDVEEGYSVSRIGKDGNTGKDGNPGKDGVGIKSTAIHYATSSSGTAKPTSGWASTVPSVAPGNYLWTRTTWTYTDNDTEEGYSVARIGKDGGKGDAGKGIKDQTVTYQNHTNGTTAPTGSWSSSPSPVKGRYLWTRTVTTYTEGDPVTTYAVAYNATDGQNGDDGTGISSTQVRYQQSTSGSTTPTGTWQTSIPTPTKGRYLWTRTIITYTDGTNSTAYSTSYYATDGTNGTNGKDGKDGTGIKSAVIAYTIHTSGTSTPTSGWVSTVPSPEKGKYMWTRTITTYTDNTTSTTYSVAYQATDGQQGPKGADGSNGTGVSSSAVTYAQTTSGTTTPTSWNATRPAPIKGQYLWSRTIITYTNGTSSTAYSTSYSATDGQRGPQGPQGPPGIPGDKGDDGKSQWVHIRYSANSNGSGMTTNPSSTTKYIGIAVTNSATAPTSPGYKWSKYIGENGSNGSQGPQGVPGKNGTNGTTTYTWVRYADTPTSGMNQYPAGKKYIGLAFNKTTQTESSNYSDYKWSLMPQNIEIGMRNLILDSGTPIESSVYLVKEYFISEDFVEGQEYTVTIKGTKSSAVNFGLWQNTGSSQRGHFKHVKDDLYQLTFTSVATTAGNQRRIRIYQPPSGSAGKATIEWIKMVKGDYSSLDWTEAPEDTQGKIDEKADQSGTSTILQSIQDALDIALQEETAAALQNELSEFIKNYNKKQEAEAEEKAASEKRLKTIEGKEALTETHYKDMVGVKTFIDRAFYEGEEGLMIKNGKEGTHILINDERIAFYSDGTETAYISQNKLSINDGTFIENLQIGNITASNETNKDHLTFRHIPG